MLPGRALFAYSHPARDADQARDLIQQRHPAVRAAGKAGVPMRTCAPT